DSVFQPRTISFCSPGRSRTRGRMQDRIEPVLVFLGPSESPIMAHLSPLNNRHEAAEASFLDFGAGDDTGPSARVVETFGEIEAEYAAIRKGVALLDLPQRATIRVTG